MKRTARIFAYLLVALSASISPVYADNLTPGDLLFNLDFVYAGSATPPGTPPWLTATFADVGSNSVQLTLAYSALNAGNGQYVSSWFFNFNPNLDVLGLDIRLLSGIAADPIIKASDGVRAGGDLLFDLQFSFAANSFNAGDTSVFLISSTVADEPIDALSFSFLSMNLLGLTNYYSAANILGGGSWIASATAQTPGPGPGPSPVPEPATAILLGFGLGGLIYFSRRKLPV
jgi:hypothetical protein